MGLFEKVLFSLQVKSKHYTQFVSIVLFLQHLIVNGISCNVRYIHTALAIHELKSTVLSVLNVNLLFQFQMKERKVNLKKTRNEGAKYFFKTSFQSSPHTIPTKKIAINPTNPNQLLLKYTQRERVIALNIFRVPVVFSSAVNPCLYHAYNHRCL